MKRLNLFCLTALTAVALGIAPSVAQQPKPDVASCLPTSRSKPFPPQSFQVLRGDGIPGSDIMEFQFTLIESMYANCRISTSYALDYRIYNHWQTSYAGGLPGNSFTHISLMSGGRNVLQDAVKFLVPMGFCGPYGQPNGRAFHMEGNIKENFFDITNSILVSTDRITGRVGKC